MKHKTAISFFLVSPSEVAIERILAIFPLAVILATVTCVIAQDKFLVSGDVVYSKDVNIYVCLHNRQTYPEWKKTLPDSSFTQMVKIDASGKASFTFRDVLKGEYIIVAFADENGNGKFDLDATGHGLERWWAYKENTLGIGGINWYDQKFEVDKDMAGITLK